MGDAIQPADYPELAAFFGCKQSGKAIMTFFSCQSKPGSGGKTK
ncbi:hypothetical protein [Candidatus Electrothrix sp.]